MFLAGCEAYTFTLSINYWEHWKPTMVNWKCDCIAAHPASEGHNEIMEWHGKLGWVSVYTSYGSMLYS